MAQLNQASPNFSLLEQVLSRPGDFTFEPFDHTLGALPDDARLAGAFVFGVGLQRLPGGLIELLPHYEAPLTGTSEEVTETRRAVETILDGPAAAGVPSVFIPFQQEVLKASLIELDDQTTLLAGIAVQHSVELGGYIPGVIAPVQFEEMAWKIIEHMSPGIPSNRAARTAYHPSASVLALGRYLHLRDRPLLRRSVAAINAASIVAAMQKELPVVWRASDEIVKAKHLRSVPVFDTAETGDLPEIRPRVAVG